MPNIRRYVLDAAPIVLARKVRDAVPFTFLKEGTGGVPDGVQAITPVTIPVVPRSLTEDYYDVIDDGTVDRTGYTIVYDSYMDEQGQIYVTKDLFGEGDFPHTYSGWPIPGDPYENPTE